MRRAWPIVFAIALATGCGRTGLGVAEAGADAPIDVVTYDHPIAPDVPIDVPIDAPCVPVSPRPIAPLSTARVTSQSPSLVFVPADDTSATHVLLCRDRACTDVVASMFAPSGVAAVNPPMPLSAGVYFWRAGAQTCSPMPETFGPTWQFTVGALSAPTDTSWGTEPDLDGDGFAELLVGAPDADTVFVFGGGLTGLTSMPIATLNGPHGSNFGFSVSSAGDVNGDGFADVLVGSTGARAYVFQGGPTGVSTVPAIVLTGSPDGAFGYGVAAVGDVDLDGYGDIIVGAYIERSAYVYNGSAAGITSIPDAMLREDEGGSSTFGASVAGAGDVNADGYDDVIVGAPVPGAAFVYLGGPDGLSTTFAARLAPSGAGFDVGVGSGAGDTDGDGRSDVIVAGESDAVYLFRGNADSVDMDPVPLTVVGVPTGSILAGAGDVNGDGFGDTIVSSDDTTAVVFLGSATGPSGGNVIFEHAPSGSSMLNAIAGAGDIDGDGFDDVALGFDSGSATVFFGAASAPGAVTTRSGGMRFGAALALVGGLGRARFDL